MAGARRCVFCGTGEVTDEHVWPGWINRFLNEEVLPGAEFGKAIFNTDPSTMQRRPGGRKWGGPQLDIKVKRVCEQCNSQWMSDVEKAAIPYLKPMIRGEQVPMGRRAREALSTWAFLRAAMAGYTHPKQMAMPESHRRWLYKERRPPPKGVYVWLAGYLGEQWGCYYQHVPLSTHRRPFRTRYRSDRVNAYGVTFSVYKVVFQVFGSTTAPKDGDLRHTGPLAESPAASGPTGVTGLRSSPNPSASTMTGSKTSPTSSCRGRTSHLRTRLNSATA